MTDNKKIETMETLAKENGYKIKESRTPAYDFIHAIKEDIKIHIATLSNNECKINTLESFKKEIEMNKIITYQTSENSKKISIEEFLNKFRFVSEPKIINLTDVTKYDDDDLFLEYNKDGKYWSKTYCKDSISGVYVSINFN